MADLKDAGRLCLWCEHCYLSMGTPGYSELTPGDEMEMECQKGHFKFQRYGLESEYRKILLTAIKCPDYKLNERIAQEISNA